MNVSFIIAGFIFLSNPNIGIVDVLPDFIGLILIIHGIGLSKLFTHHWESACRVAVILSGISILKTGCIPLLFRDVPSLPIVLSFSFALIECFLLISFSNRFFEELFYIGIRHEIPSVFSDPAKDNSSVRKSKTEIGVKVKRCSYAFFIIRSALSVLPDISDLHIASDTETVFDYSSFRSLLTAIVIVLGTLAAVYFLVQLLPYLIRIAKDPGKKNFDERCDAIYCNPSIEEKRRMRRGLFLLIALILTSVFVSIDGIIFPALIPAVISVFLIITLTHYDRRVLLLIIPAVLCVVSSVFDFLFRRKFFIEMNNEPEASLWSPASSQVYDSVKLFTFLERTLLLIIVFSILLFLLKRIKNDALKFLESNDNDSFLNERIKGISKKHRLFTFLSVPLFLLTAFEPIIVLEIDVFTVIMSVITTIWTVLMIISIYDVIKILYQYDTDNIND